MMAEINLDLLDQPFEEREIEWRVQHVKEGEKPVGMAVPYIDNRAIMRRLDMAVGKANWSNRYEAGPQGGIICVISIRIDGEWVSKSDGAENTDFEPVKGGLSDSMKRAAVQWGIGRGLYDLDPVWHPVEKRGKNWQLIGRPSLKKAGSQSGGSTQPEPGKSKGGEPVFVMGSGWSEAPAKPKAAAQPASEKPQGDVPDLTPLTPAQRRAWFQEKLADKAIKGIMSGTISEGQQRNIAIAMSDYFKAEGTRRDFLQYHFGSESRKVDSYSLLHDKEFNVLKLHYLATTDPEQIAAEVKLFTEMQRAAATAEATS